MAKKTEEKEDKITKTIKEIFTESVMILGEIKQPKGDRVAPRIYISTRHIEPKGELEINKQYKIFFFSVKESSKMDKEEIKILAKRCLEGFGKFVFDSFHSEGEEEFNEFFEKEWMKFFKIKPGEKTNGK